jgi:hypothetical protein
MSYARRHVATNDPELVPKELNWDELEPHLNCTNAVLIDAYQTQAGLQRLATDPVPDDVHNLVPELGRLIAKNSTMYPPEIEDEFATDPVIEAIVEARKLHRFKAEEIARMYRARRTILAYLLQKCVGTG